jgi:hypothetical protein
MPMRTQNSIRAGVCVALLLGTFPGALAWPEEKDEHGIIRDSSGTIRRGVVTSIGPADPQSGFVATMLLEANPEKPDRRNQVRVNIYARTVIKVAAGKETKQAKVADLKKGQRVQLVKVEGFLYSLPPVADVTEILVLDEGK